MHPKLQELFVGKGRKINQHRFAIYVPSRLKDFTKIEQTRYKVLCEMTREFLHTELGGLTTYRAQGLWKHEGKLHHEVVLVMESYCPVKTLIEKGKRVRDFVNALAIEFEQEEMACVVDGEMVFFGPTEAYREIYAKLCARPTKVSGDASEVIQQYVLAKLKAGNLTSVLANVSAPKKKPFVRASPLRKSKRA
jgi:hypothetical protein